MKKIIKVSLVAMLVATPMVASAALPGTKIQGTGENGAIVPNTDVATTSYVQGAYNAAIDVINEEHARATGVEGSLDSLNADLKTLDAQENNVSTLVSALNKEDTKVGSLSTLTAATTGAFDSAQADLATAVNTAMATAKAAAAGSNSAIGTYNTTDGSHTYIDTTSNSTVAGNLQLLDAQVTANTNKLGSTAMGTTDQNITSVTAAIAELNGSNTTAGSVSYKVKNDAADADFAKDSTNTNSASLGSAATLETAINAVATATDTNTTGIANVVSGQTNISYDHTTSGLTATNVKAAIDELAAAQSAAGTTVSTNGNYIKSANNVATNLGNLDTAVKANATALTTIKNTTIPVYGTWNSDSSTGSISPYSSITPAADVQ